MAQWVKYLVLSLQWLRSLLWHGCDLWSRNFHMPQVWPKKKKKSLVASVPLFYKLNSFPVCLNIGHIFFPVLSYLILLSFSRKSLLLYSSSRGTSFQAYLAHCLRPHLSEASTHCSGYHEAFLPWLVGT